jgi:hypothetical protein
MTSMNDKEKAHENKYAHDKELEFKINARRNKLLGLWVAEKIALPVEKHDAYAKEVVLSDFEKAGDDDVFEKVKKDLFNAGLRLTDKEIREEMYRLIQIARDQVTNE